MNLPNFFTLRFKKVIAGTDFLAEVDCDNLGEVFEKSFRLQQEVPGTSLSAALIGFHLGKLDGKGVHLLDAESEELFADVLTELHMGAEHYYNERTGAPDRYTNRVKPSDLGVFFPDGSLRVVWEKEHALLDLDASVDIVRKTLELLLRVQAIPYFRQTAEEIDNNDVDSVIARRLELLLKAGLWPTDAGKFDPELDITIRVLLHRYAEKTMAPQG